MPARPASRMGAAAAFLTIAGLIAVSSGPAANEAARSAPIAEPECRHRSQRPAAREQCPGSGAGAQSQQEKEIRAFDNLYVRDFNSGNIEVASRSIHGRRRTDRGGWAQVRGPNIDRRVAGRKPGGKPRGEAGDRGRRDPAARPGCRQGRRPHDRHAGQRGPGHAVAVHGAVSSNATGTGCSRACVRSLIPGEPSRPAPGSRVDDRRLARRGP